MNYLKAVLEVLSGFLFLFILLNYGAKLLLGFIFIGIPAFVVGAYVYHRKEELDREDRD